MDKEREQQMKSLEKDMEEMELKDPLTPVELLELVVKKLLI